MIGLSSVCALRGDVRYRIVQDQAVVIRQQEGELLVLNELGGKILKLTEGKQSVRKIVDQLAESYDVERKELEADVLEFLQEMLESGVAAEITP